MTTVGVKGIKPHAAESWSYPCRERDRSLSPARSVTSCQFPCVLRPILDRKQLKAQVLFCT